MMEELLGGKRILVVEDEYFIASDLKRMLSRKGASPVGPASDVETGLALASNEALDAAVLDVNLGEARSFAIADRLAERGVPYLLLTGYDAWSLPKAYQHKPRLEKPFGTETLLDRVQQIIAGQDGR